MTRPQLATSTHAVPAAARRGVIIYVRSLDACLTNAVGTKSSRLTLYSSYLRSLINREGIYSLGKFFNAANEVIFSSALVS